jgi:hypothetical protein
MSGAGVFGRRHWRRQLVGLVQALTVALECLLGDHRAPEACHRCVMRGGELRRDHPLSSYWRERHLRPRSADGLVPLPPCGSYRLRRTFPHAPTRHASPALMLAFGAFRLATLSPTKRSTNPDANGFAANCPARSGHFSSQSGGKSMATASLLDTTDCEIASCLAVFTMLPVRTTTR